MYVVVARWRIGCRKRVLLTHVHFIAFLPDPHAPLQHRDAQSDDDDRRVFLPEHEPTGAAVTVGVGGADVGVVGGAVTRGHVGLLRRLLATSTHTGTVTGAADTGAADTGAGDTGAADTGAADTGAGDTGAGDTGAADTGAADTGAGDTGAGDTGAADTGAADTGAADTGAADTGAADTGAADTGAADTGAADTGAADTGATDCTSPATLS
jgi:hypothetical protein